MIREMIPALHKEAHSSFSFDLLQRGRLLVFVGVGKFGDQGFFQLS